MSDWEVALNIRAIAERGKTCLLILEPHRALCYTLSRNV